MADSVQSRRSVRLPAYDYASYGAYFVTIVTANRACLLGDVVDGRLVHTKLGRIVAEEWIRTADIRRNIELDEFVVMPNHFHAIAWITDNITLPTTGVPQHAPTTRTFSPPATGTLSATLNAFKGSVTRRARAELEIETVWQRGFYEHVIRSEKSLQAIRQYILDNPAKWADDDENPLNRR